MRFKRNRKRVIDVHKASLKRSKCYNKKGQRRKYRTHFSRHIAAKSEGFSEYFEASMVQSDKSYKSCR